LISIDALFSAKIRKLSVSRKLNYLKLGAIYITWNYIPWKIKLFYVHLSRIKTIKMKINKISYYAATGLLSVLMLFSIYMYVFDHDAVKVMFEGFGYPTYIIYPYAALKFLGVFAIWNPKFRLIKEWAYAGFFFAFILAFFAHYMIGDGSEAGALMALVLLMVSYYFNKKIKK